MSQSLETLQELCSAQIIEAQAIRHHMHCQSVAKIQEREFGSGVLAPHCGAKRRLKLLCNQISNFAYFLRAQGPDRRGQPQTESD